MLLAPLAVLKKGLTSTQHQHAATTLLQHWSRQFLVTSNNNRRAASSTNRVANQFAEVSKQSSFASSHQQHQQQEQTTAAVVLGTAACACPHHHLHHQQQQQPQHMTTSHKQQRKQLQHPSLAVPSATAAAARSSKSSSSRSRDSGSGKAALNSSTVSEPSSSSNGSDLCTLLDNTRPTSRALSPAAVSTKSAKRKAAEALLAAQYGGLGGGGSSSGAFAAAGTTTAAAAGRAGASASGMHAARFMSDVSALPPASSPAMLSNKKRKSMLSTAINRLGGAAAATAPVSVVEGSPEASATVAAAAAAATTTQTSYAAAQALPDVVVPAAETLLQQQQQQQPDQTRSSSQHDVATSRQPTHVHFDESGAAITAADADASAAAAGGHSHAHSPAVVPVEAAGAAAQQQHGSSSARAAQPPLQQQQQQSVVVPACADDCAHTYSQGWCHSQVQLPHLDWGRVLDADMAQAPTFKLAQGYERLHMPGGIQVLVVENHVHLPAALSQLRCSMQDPVVAIDLEWRPQFGKGFTPVAMVQLASSRVAVLIRTCHMGYRLPPALRDFLKDPQVHLLGFSWAGQDESKMQSTFGVGSKDFGRFLDLQQVAQGLGYHGFGLARLTRQVLGLPMPKSKKISMSNWECNTLSRGQVKYAALDVLVAGQVFRALRLWHSSPSLCEVCHSNLGVPTNQQMFVCAECDKPFWSIRGYTEHCERNSHKLEWAECEGCGCARQLPFASSKSAAAATAAGLEDEAEADEQ